MNSLIVAPSILAGDHADLKSSLREIADAGAQWVHLDIMDGHFVPNLTFGPQAVADLRKSNDSIFFDTHLMLDNPHEYVEAFIKAGSQNVTIHVEPDYPIEETLKKIREMGSQCGISLNPGTPAEAIEPYLKDVDLVLVMTVQPGFGGQSFREDMLSKIETISRWRNEHGLSFRLEVDGGVDVATGPRCREAGADTFVAGTAFFKAPSRQGFIESLQSAQ